MCDSMYMKCPKQAHAEMESGLLVARGWGRGMGNDYQRAQSFFGGDENVTKNYGDVCTTLWIY